MGVVVDRWWIRLSERMLWRAHMLVAVCVYVHVRTSNNRKEGDWDAAACAARIPCALRTVWCWKLCALGRCRFHPCRAARQQAGYARRGVGLASAEMGSAQVVSLVVWTSMVLHRVDGTDYGVLHRVRVPSVQYQ